MKTISWFLRVCVSVGLFIAALGFAVSNTALTELKFFGVDFYWRAPLVVFLLIFFAAGVAIGLLAVAPTLFNQRREVGKLKKQIAKASIATPVAETKPPSVDAVLPAVASSATSYVPPSVPRI